MQRFDPFDGALGLSLATIHNGLVWVTGMVGVGEDLVTTPDSPLEQMRNAFNNITAILQGCDSDFSYIIDMTIFFVGEATPVSEAWATLRTTYFADGLPSLTMVGVARLSEPRYVVEVKVIATTNKQD